MLERAPSLGGLGLERASAGKSWIGEAIREICQIRGCRGILSYSANVWKYGGGDCK